MMIMMMMMVQRFHKLRIWYLNIDDELYVQLVIGRIIIMKLLLSTMRQCYGRLHRMRDDLKEWLTHSDQVNHERNWKLDLVNHLGYI